MVLGLLPLGGVINRTHELWLQNKLHLSVNSLKERHRERKTHLHYTNLREELIMPRKEKQSMEGMALKRKKEIVYKHIKQGIAFFPHLSFTYCTSYRDLSQK